MYSKQARLASEVSTLKFMKYSFVIYIISIILGGGGKSETPLLQNVPIAGFFFFSILVPAILSGGAYRYEKFYSLLLKQKPNNNNIVFICSYAANALLKGAKTMAKNAPWGLKNSKILPRLGTACKDGGSAAIFSPCYWYICPSYFKS